VCGGWGRLARGRAQEEAERAREAARREHEEARSAAAAEMATLQAQADAIRAKVCAGSLWRGSRAFACRAGLCG
jgi:hypothetical protein